MRALLLVVAFLLAGADVARATEPGTPLAIAEQSTEDLDRAEPGELFLEANQLHDDGEYKAAIARYTALVDRGLESGPIWFNLGNSYLRSGSLGKAISAYLHSEALSPRDEDVRANLDFARKSAKDALEPPTVSPVWRTLFFWHFLFSRAELANVVGVLNVLFWGALAVRLYRPQSELLRWGVAGLFVPLVAFAGSLAYRTVQPVRTVVVQEQEIEVYAGTSTDAVVRFQLHEGTEARLVETLDDWVRISLSDGKDGWVERERVDVLRL